MKKFFLKYNRLFISFVVLVVIIGGASIVSAYNSNKHQAAKVTKKVVINKPQTVTKTTPTPISLPPETASSPSTTKSSTPVTQTTYNSPTLASECTSAQTTYEQSVMNNQDSVTAQLQALKTQATANNESNGELVISENAVYTSNNSTLAQYYSTYTSAVSAIPGCFATQQEVTYTLLPAPPPGCLPGYPGLC